VITASETIALQWLCPKVDSVLLRTFFVAERRLNLARPFKAGIEKKANHVASATLE
jgi:hypothetical protein